MFMSMSAAAAAGPPSARLPGDDAHSGPVCPAQDLAAPALLPGASDVGGFAFAHSFADPRVALFLVDHDTPPQRLRDLLAASWDLDALTALKLVCYLGGARKPGDREGFYTAALWMHHNHPRTLAENLSAFAELGCIQDFPELLYRLVQEADAACNNEDMPRAKVEAPAIITRKRARDLATAAKRWIGAPAPRHVAPQKRKKLPRAPHLAAVAQSMYRNDPAYRCLHDSVADFFATNLRNDTCHLNNGTLSQIGLAAKWCPSPASPIDRTILLFDAIARRLLPVDHHLNADADAMRKILRLQMLAPLKSALPSVKAMSVTASVGALPPLPNRIVQSMCRKGKGDEGKPTPQQVRAIAEWRTMLDRLRSEGVLTNSVVVCDISLTSKLRAVSVALALIISELSDNPWKNWVLPFAEEGCHLLVGSLLYKMERLRKIKCGSNFNLKSVYEWVFTLGMQQGKVALVRTIFVLTGKDFEEALVPPCKMRGPQYYGPNAVHTWKHDYRMICEKFKDGGFDSVPQVVFWNLAGQRSASLTLASDGVLRVSGYSDDFMRLFLKKSGVVEAEDEMFDAVAGKKYQKLRVVD